MKAIKKQKKVQQKIKTNIAMRWAVGLVMLPAALQ